MSMKTLISPLWFWKNVRNLSQKNKNYTKNAPISLSKQFFIDWFLEWEKKGERKKHWFVVPLIYAFIDWFLYAMTGDWTHNHGVWGRCSNPAVSNLFGTRDWFHGRRTGEHRRQSSGELHSRPGVGDPCSNQLSYPARAYHFYLLSSLITKIGLMYFFCTLLFVCYTLNHVFIFLKILYIYF